MKNENKTLYYELESFYLICDSEGNELYRIRGLMGSLVRKARKQISSEIPEAKKIQRLFQLVYEDWKFHCDPENYFCLRNLYLPYLLETHSGSPMSLGAIVLYLAESLGLPIYPVDFPAQFILRAEINRETVFIDPWNGKPISLEKLYKLHEGVLGFGAKIQAADLAKAETPLLVSRLRQLIKNTLIREDKNELALEYINRLMIHTDNVPPEHFRDRGFALAQMGAFQAAIEDFEYFIKQSPDDPTAVLLKFELVNMKQELTQEAIH
ncbi:SirB1 family protein [Rodentibacter caecimuris]|uniref:Protein SirB1 N-terminal domain-containing protein n=1 Tax=Rodentibacter caecimuris TaxID=1796644 RepID=A0ABX3KW87_9PAST|nr:hypothetical protein BKG89_07150 [Rodentibacter heylii]